MFLYIDIETIPSQDEGLRLKIAEGITAPGNYKKQESIQKWLDDNLDIETEKELRKTSLNGTVGEIICISWAINDDDPKVIGRTLEELESKLLINFMELVRKDLEHPNTEILESPVWVGHYHTMFDLRFIWQRCVINKVTPTIDIPYKSKPWDKDVFDTKYEWTGSAAHSGYGSMDAISSSMGLGGKGDINGSKVWGYIKAGKYDEIEEYCKDDVDRTREMHKRMTFRN